jgi:hypothetical protein
MNFFYLLVSALRSQGLRRAQRLLGFDGEFIESHGYVILQHMTDTTRGNP